MTLTLEQMRDDIADALHLDPAEVTEDENLTDLGLDSMRLMNLILRWQEAGVLLDFAAYAETATLAEWWAMVSRTQGEAWN